MKAAPSRKWMRLPNSQAWFWTMALAVGCLLLMPAPPALADDAEAEAAEVSSEAQPEAADASSEAEVQVELAETQKATAEMLEELRRAQEQLEQIEAQRAAALDQIRQARDRLAETEREAQAARDRLQDANTALGGIEQERTMATRELIDASISTTSQPEEGDGQEYTVTGLIIEYATDHPGLPAPEELMAVKVNLLRTMSGIIAPRKGELNSGIRLVDIPALTEQRFYDSALRQMCVALVSYFNDQGLIGVYVGADPTQIDRAGTDLRAEGQTTLKIIVRVAVVGPPPRTVGTGERFGPGERINNPAHAKLRRHLRLQPAMAGEPGSGSLLRRDLLDEQIYLLNRHPGRRVDVAISADDQTPGAAQLDLLIREIKPWTAYFQVSNTGTDSTNEWRERFGFVHNNLTNNDDILSIDYLTANFDEVHSVVASYEAPLMDSERVRWRAHGLWSEYTASDLGLVPEQFMGDEWSVGGELIANIHQNKRFFVDLVAGATWRSIRTENVLLTGAAPQTLTEGEGDFFLPHFGLKFENATDTSSTEGSVSLKFNVDAIAGTESENVFFPGTLGRIHAEDDYTVLEFGFSHSTFLEPLFDREAWQDTTTPKSSTLAHELYLALRGQTSFGDRLIPQEVMAIGGLYTVRGYEPSEVTGDTVVVATAEYRYHVPRALALRAEPGALLGRPFKWAPQQVYGQPDWDLILRAFVDAGHAVAHERKIWETNETLIGTGLGVELLVKRNLSVRADWGVALDDTAETDAGNSEVHFVATLLY